MRARLSTVFVLFCSLIFCTQITAASSDLLSDSASSSRPQIPSYKLTDLCNNRYYVGFGGTLSESLSNRSIDHEFVSAGLGGADVSDSQRNTVKQHRPGIGFLGLVGYRLNPILSLEGFFTEYAWTQKVQYIEQFNLDILSQSTNKMVRIKTLNFGPRALIAAPISRYFSPYLLLGFGLRWTKTEERYLQDGQFSIPRFFSGSDTDTQDDTKKTWTVEYNQGFGVRSDLTKNIGVRLEVYAPFFTTTNTLWTLITSYSF